MKFLAVLVLLSTCVFAQGKPPVAAPLPPGCGTTDIKFKIGTDKHKHPFAQPEAGKALLYLIEDDSNFFSRPRPSTRMGVDGAWIGANHGSSYFYISVQPGEHHLCANWQTYVAIGAGQPTAAAHLTAEAGTAYFFVVRNTFSQATRAAISLDPVDSDEAQILMRRFAFSTFHPK